MFRINDNGIFFLTKGEVYKSHKVYSFHTLMLPPCGPTETLRENAKHT